jgi:hypothetical protein
MCWRPFVISIGWNVQEKRYAMRGVLLAEVAPDWLLAQIDGQWFDRDSRRFDEYRFRHPRKVTASSWQRLLEPMAITCLQPCIPQRLLPG